MLFEGTAEQDDVVNISQRFFPTQSTQHQLHKSLKCGRRIAHTEAEFPVLHEALCAVEGGLLPIFWPNFNLVEPLPLIQGAEPTATH
jgi:hypothetical protein